MTSMSAMPTPPLDDIDRRILNCLLEDASRSHKEIGQAVHMTGQAVGARVRRLEELGVIQGYTIRLKPDKAGTALTALVTVFMRATSSHAAFQRFLEADSRVAEAHRVSGEGCYWLRVQVEDHAALTAFLDDLLPYAYHRVSLSSTRVK